MKMRALEKVQEISERLAPCGVDATRKEAELVIRGVLDIDQTGLYRDNPELDDFQTRTIEQLVARRCEREPLQYILGYTDFLDVRIYVGEGVLIPRPETELLAEHAIKTVKSYELGVMSKRQNSKLLTRDSDLCILDLCTGSGCLALALANKFHDAMVYGTDISEKAITYANMNARLNRINNVNFYCGNLFSPVNPKQFFDLIISNPPYIRTDDIKKLEPEIRDWEPHGALDGGPDGLNFYKELIPAATRFVEDKGIVMLELGDGLADAVNAIFEKSGYLNIEIFKDFAGIERIIQAQWIK